ncbi:MAG: hypothetical protein WA755_13560 [Candidatus Acidiferrales bacterium]
MNGTAKITMLSAKGFRQQISGGALLLAVLAVSTGCDRAAPGRLDGEVFIVTEGAENVKLGLVEVRVLPYEETKNSIAKTRARAEPVIATLQPKLDASKKTYDTVNARWEATQDTAAMKAAWSAYGKLTELDKQVRHWNSGELYFASLPSPVATVKTDADGKFSIPLDRQTTVVLAANATRRVFDKTEDYYWLVTVSLDGQLSKRIFLSNDNLATSESKDSLVHVVE